jgi:general secretion pathway protein D
MRKTKFILTTLTIHLLLATSRVDAQTIAEKKAGTSLGAEDMTQEMQQFLAHINEDLKASQAELHRLYAQVNVLFHENAPPYAYEELLFQINTVRENVLALETSWREMAIQGGRSDTYALWHQPETTLGQLVEDYGSQEFVYLLSPEIASIKISVNSNLPIPRSSWNDMLEVILSESGVGFRQLNPFLRELILLKDNRSNLQLITNRRQDLDLFAPNARVCYVLTPEPSEVRRIWLFLDKFVNPNSTSLQMVGRDILIIGPVAEVQDLLKLNDFVAANKGDKEYKVFPITRVNADEMARILSAIFDQGNESQKIPTESRERGINPSMPPLGTPPGMNPRFRPPGSPPTPFGPPSAVGANDATDVNGLRIIALSNIARALFLIGTKEEIKKAEQIIHQVESQVGEARERVIYWYTVKNSDPEDLAEVLQKIYALMVKTGVGIERGPEMQRIQIQPVPSAGQIANEIIAKERDALPSELYQTSYYQQGNYVVNPSPVEPRRQKAPTFNKDRDNFIVDPKTGSIAMVIEADILPKIKELIKKLDVPKRMVQIEALLFERRVTKENNFGLNLLRIGDCAEGKNFNCFDFGPTGLLQFILSRKQTCSMPAYDLTYRFLMTQEDIQINASPSVVAINQTPATIAIVEEISINTGIYNIETIGGVTLQKAFTRAQYGITIEITPTIHITNEDDDYVGETNYVTLDTDITFDTVQPGREPERPDVTRRHITNEVRIPDGQTVILGGLRRKTTDDKKESIPFIGELPGIGKLFSMRDLSDSETEMFIFLTPTIISDPLDDFEKIKCAEMHRRPGDIPEFLCGLVAAREYEKNRLMANSMVMLFGPEPDRCYSPSYWRPSTCGNEGMAWMNDENGMNSNPECSAGPDSCGEYDGR